MTGRTYRIEDVNGPTKKVLREIAQLVSDGGTVRITEDRMYNVTMRLVYTCPDE